MNREKCKYKNNHKLAPDYFRKMYDRVLNTPSEITILTLFVRGSHYTETSP